MREFDIAKHEFSDGSDLSAFQSSPHGLCVTYGRRTGSERIHLSKKDAIAIAKHFNLTAEDFK